MGRHPECEIVLDVGAVSRQHAQILASDGQYYVEDLKSRNGTFVNDQQIEGRHLLHDQDELKICDMVFSFDNAPPKPTIDHDNSTTAMLVDDQETSSSSTIMTKLDMSTSASGLRVTVKPEVKLRALIEITQSLAKSLALEDVLPKILDSLFKIFVQADRGFILLYETAGGPLVPKAVKYRRADADERARISKTIVNEVLASKQAILSADAASDSRFGMSESIADFRIRSMMCAPLIDSEGNALGVIQVDTLDQRARFQQEDLDVLASVASQAALAVGNAKAHDIEIQQQKLRRDLDLARNVQLGFLPQKSPEPPGYTFFNHYFPANEVGGDYFDYVELPDNRLAIIVADVAGKGIPAALMVARLSGDSKFWLASERDPARAVMLLNNRISATIMEDRFVTFILLVLDLNDHSVTIVNAGHMPPILRRPDGSIEEIGGDISGVPLGVDGDFEYESCKITLGEGECLTSYTDGISEAMNEKRECYHVPDNERIFTQVKSPGANKPAEQGKLLLDDVKKFVGRHPQSDDMCLVIFGRDAAA
jgi:serine phosphatase RsbU (regulator of sigma subunit)